MAIDGLELLTDRLRLRPVRGEDFEAWAAFSADPVAMHHLGGVQPRAVAWRGLLTVVGAWHVQGFSFFSVFERDTGRWVGRAGPWQPEGWPGTEVGYSLARDAWGRGYATEAAAACIDWAVDHLGWTDIIQTIAPDNLPSQAVARRLGATLRGPCRLPPPYENQPAQLWGQTRGQWRQNRLALRA
ncbi:GNAT family N-acetyltransferase [Arenimonas caeni]|jgi:RimJ/RimL family protein N-acetyltransferase|uniref:GNAT family N-acetyltransferase n=1 Tax=Arenimonas caeni TaxID=2058085 RepID=UPI002A3648DA|nr:GNAT family N-acetyltransferase [Arenimonas caeni]MDY0022392.1 GNAT family N-acetyltransferase [Arenimonas caeni]